LEGFLTLDNNNGKNMQESDGCDTQNGNFVQEDDGYRLNGYFLEHQSASPEPEPFVDKDRNKMLKIWKWIGIITLIIVTAFTGAFAGMVYACESSLLSDSTFFDAFMAKWAGVTENRIELDKYVYDYTDSSTELAEKVLATTVRVKVVYQAGGKETVSSNGSGVIYAKHGNKYTVITNYHVVTNEMYTGYEIECIDGKTYKATVYKKDETSDIAIMYFESEEEYSVTDIADSKNAKAGQSIIVGGNPLGHGFGVSFGHVSNPRRVTTANNNVPLMTIDASVNPGNSGGGVYDYNGNLLALVVAKATGTDVDGVGYAIPVDTVNEVVTDLLTLGYVKGRPLIGITVSSIYTIDAYNSAMNGELAGYLPDVNDSFKPQYFGVYIFDSENPKLKKGDRLIKVDGKTITVNDDVSNALLSHRAGEAIEIVVERIEGDDVHKYTLQVLLKEKTTSD
jgi:S1-C subfamily serine protease